MDRPRLDALARSLASRRVLLGGMLVAALGPAAPSAARHKHKHKRCKAGFTSCPGPTGKKVCVDLQSDPDHCGQCARACPADQGCRAASCVSTCAPTCDDGNPCTNYVCDPRLNVCSHVSLSDNTACGTSGLCCRGQCCVDQGASTCGTTGRCAGGECARYIQGTVCESAKCVNDFTLQRARTCGVDGACSPATTVDCGPYRCSALAVCYTACGGPDECVNGASCCSGVCCMQACVNDQCPT